MNQYNSLCWRLRMKTNQAAADFLEIKDRENPAWIANSCPVSNERSWFTWFSVSMDDLVSGVCLATVACMLISATATHRLVIQTADLMLMHEQTPALTSSKPDPFLDDNHNEFDAKIKM